MLLPSPDDEHVVARLLDFFGSGTPWQRRLWDIGTVLALEEVLEGAEALAEGALTEATLNYMCDSLIPLAGQDPGLGSSDDHRLIHACLKERVKAARHHQLVLAELLAQIRTEYLSNWATALAAASRPKPERVARGIAGHLLDLGFSPNYLHRWWSYRLKNAARMTLVDMVNEAHALANTAPQSFEVLVALGAIPKRVTPMPPRWLDAPGVSTWLTNNGSNSRNIRQSGGVVFQIKARDVWAAANQAFELADRLAARVAAGTRQQLFPLDGAWVKGHVDPVPRTRRSIEIGSLERNAKLYVLQSGSDLDAALELLSPLDTGGSSPAVAGSWAAIESLLIGPDDRTNRVIAADRLADLVACSFPRAELTTLAYKHMLSATDALATALRGLPTNRARAEQLADHLAAGGNLAVTDSSDIAATSRRTEALGDPGRVLTDVQGHASRIFKRFHRQRNLVLHSGRVTAVALDSSLRTAAPLIGAGLDRIAHAWFTEHLSALKIAARARVHLEFVGTARGRKLVDLLEA